MDKTVKKSSLVMICTRLSRGEIEQVKQLTYTRTAGGAVASYVRRKLAEEEAQSGSCKYRE